jgi:hypothetical protein
VKPVQVLESIQTRIIWHLEQLQNMKEAVLNLMKDKSKEFLMLLNGRKQAKYIRIYYYNRDYWIAEAEGNP